MAASIRLELFAQRVHGDLSHIWLSKETKARVCTQASIDLGGPWNVDVENVFIIAARTGSSLSILSPGLRERQYTLWSDGSVSWQRSGQRFESVESLVVMVAIDSKEKLPRTQLSTDCLGGVVIMIASALCRRVGCLLKCTYLWLAMLCRHALGCFAALWACQYTFWSDRDARCQQYGRRSGSVKDKISHRSHPEGGSLSNYQRLTFLCVISS